MTKALQPDDLIAHYRVIRALGAGGMGEVYLARDSTLDRDIALKVLPQMAQDDDRVRRFVLEAKSASSLSHPHIITVYEIGCEPVISGGVPRPEKVHYIAMELVDGAALADIIHDDTHRTDLKTLLGYLAQAADGLAKAHASGIVHRDLKPGNIMVSKDGYAKVLDFGLAKLVEKETAPDATIDVRTKQALTVEGMIVGTIGYMAPEQILGRPVDARSDIFSFGCILYEAITRQRPFQANSQFEALQKIIHEHPAPMEAVVAEVPGDLRTLVGRCLAKSPDERIQSMKDVSSDLRRIAGSYEVLARSAAAASDQTVFFPSASGTVPPPSGVAPPSGAAWSTPAPSTVVLPPAAAPAAKKTLPVAALAGVALVVLALAGFGVWKFALGKSGGGLSEEALSAMKIAPVLSNDFLVSIAVSPEGKYAGHVSQLNGKWQLQIRQISTGADIDIVKPQDLAITGLSFTPDGDHLWFCMFDKDNQQYSSLYEVPSLGGTPKKKVSDADTPPTFSPDGKRIAFVRGSPNEKKASLIISQEDGSDAQPVASLPADVDNALVKPRWSPDGTTIAVVYSAEAGKPSLLLFDVTSKKQQTVGRWDGPLMDSVAWMGSTGLVVAGAPAPGPSQLWYVALPGGERRRLTNDISGYTFVTTSADGKTITARRDQRTSEVWEVPVSGGEVKARTRGKESISSLAAATDGTLLFNAPQEDLMTLWAMKPDGTRTVIAPKSMTVLSHRFMPSQNATAFTAYGADSIPHIHRADVDGANPKQLTSGAGGETIVTVAPDGKFVLYNTPQLSRTLMVLPSDGSAQPRALATDYIDQINTLIFSPDARLASYNHQDPAQQKAVSVRTVVNFADGKAAAQLPLHAGYQFTRDGGALTYVQNRAPSDPPEVQAAVYKIGLSGGTPQKLFEMADTRIDLVRWPDEKTAVIAAFSLKSQVHNLWKWTVGSAKPVQLTQFPSGFIFEFVTSQDGKTVYFTQGSNNRDIIKITGLVK